MITSCMSLPTQPGLPPAVKIVVPITYGSRRNSESYQANRLTHACGPSGPTPCCTQNPEKSFQLAPPGPLQSCPGTMPPTASSLITSGKSPQPRGFKKPSYQK